MLVRFENALVPIWKLRVGAVVEWASNFYHIEMLGVINFLGDGTAQFPIKVKNVVHPEGSWLKSETLIWPNP